MLEVLIKTVRNSALLGWILFLLSFGASCSRAADYPVSVPTLMPTAVSIVVAIEPPQVTGTEVQKPPLPATSTPPATITPEKTNESLDAVTVAPTSQESSPTIEIPSATPTIEMLSATPTIAVFTSTPTQPPPTPTQTATSVSTPLPPLNIWPEPTQHPYPLSEAPRHGAAAAFGAGDGSGILQEDYSWTYSWTPYVPPLFSSLVEHVPMLTGSPSDGIPAYDTIVEMDSRAEHNYWLVFNECEQHWQCNSSPQDAARFYHDQVVSIMYEQGADADARIIVGGVNSHECGIQWLVEFVTYYESNYGELPRAGWHFHVYPEIKPNTWPSNCSGQWDFDDTLFGSPDEAYALWSAKAFNALAFVQQYGRPEDEIWFTEIGCLNHGFHQIQGPVCQASGFVESYAPKILAWLNDEGRWVTRYAWYTNWDTNYWGATKLFSSVDGPWQYSSLGWFFSQILPASSVR